VSIEFINSLVPTIQNLGVFGYWFVFFIALVESLAFIGSVVPGAVVIVGAGFLSAQGYFDLGDLIWFAALGAIIGDGISYWLGTKGTRFFRNENRILKLSHLEKGEQFFKRHGNKSVFLGRFIGLLRPIVPFIAGLSKMNKWSFLSWNIASAFLWAGFQLLLGYFFGGAFKIIEIWSTRVWLLFFFFIVSILFLWFILKRCAPFFRFLKSLFISIEWGIATNPDIKRFVKNHPKLSEFMRRRFDRDQFSGLPLTLLAVVFIYVLSLLLGVIQGVITSAPIVEVDIRVANLLYIFRDAEVIKVFSWITLLAKWEIVVSAAIIMSVILWLRQKSMYLFPLWIVIAGSELLNLLGKLFFHRVRPIAALYTEGSFSFPSGHATMAVAFYGFIVYIISRHVKRKSKKINIVFWGLLVILAIGFSRLYLGVHYWSDVWGGYLLGLLWLIIGISISEWCEYRRDVQPYTLTKRVKLISAALIAAEVIFYIGFALRYQPVLNAQNEVTQETTIMNILDAFHDNKLSRFTETLTGKNQEPLNIIIISKNDEQLIYDMHAAGWSLADPVDFASMSHLAKSALLRQDYSTAPMTPSFWNTTVHDLGFEKPTLARNVSERHHARFWRTQFIIPDGRRIYMGTASQDSGIKWLITHRIKPDIDTEREFLFSDLENTGLVLYFQREQLVDPTLGTNFSGDQFFTDGKVYVVFLK
jgi:undecaprenyl-diphosphatase